MRSFMTFMKKEMTKQLRSGKLMILGILFVLFGIMNPAVAKLTPWLMELMAESLAQSGMTVTEVTVSALDSWTQFFKNIPMALLAFVLLEGGIFTKEYNSGTLVLSLTKGLSRYKVVVAKTLTLITLWTAGYFLCAGITYGYNAYFWDNGVAKHLGFALVVCWLFGIFTVSLMTLFSTLVKGSSGVLLGTGGVILGCYLVSIVPRVGEYLPTVLMNGTPLIYGAETPHTYAVAVIITAVTVLVSLAASIPIFNKKQL